MRFLDSSRGCNRLFYPPRILPQHSLQPSRGVELGRTHFRQVSAHTHLASIALLSLCKQYIEGIKSRHLPSPPTTLLPLKSPCPTASLLPNPFRISDWYEDRFMIY
jgi:hypothetical protein